MTHTPRVVRVELAKRSYDVRIGAGLLRELAPLVRGCLPDARRAFVVVDRVLDQAAIKGWLAPLATAGISIRHESVEAGEHAKSLEATQRLLRAMANDRLERHEPVIVVGGGVVGDLGGFAAALHRRGVPWINCPTTLLAMVDASVGGKTGVNLQAGSPNHPHLIKNAIGVFHQPRLVVIDVETLAGLPARHLRAGVAECIKHAMIAGSTPVKDPGLMDWTTAHIHDVLNHDAGAQIELIARNIAIKAGVVSADEHETSGARALLNLGHTFAHAIETLPGLDLQHGEAVGLGLIAAATTAARLGLCGAEVVHRVTDALTLAGLPRTVSNLPPAASIRARMGHDKKAVGGVLRLVLPTGTETAALVTDPSPDAVDAGIEAIRA